MVPVNVAYAEVYESLQRGVLDCTFSGVGAMETLSYGDVASHVLVFPNGSSFSGANLALNLDFWRGLDDGQRQALIDAAPTGVAGVAYDYMRSLESVKANAADEGWTIIQPDDALNARIEEYKKINVEQTIADAKQRGVDNPEEIVATFQELMSKWEDIVAGIPAGEDGRAALEDALRTEVYSKFPVIE